MLKRERKYYFILVTNVLRPFLFSFSEICSSLSVLTLLFLIMSEPLNNWFSAVPELISLEKMRKVMWVEKLLWITALSHFVWQDMIIHGDSCSPNETPEEEGAVSPTVASLPQLDAAARLAVITHSVAAFSSGLERSHLQRLSTRITSDTTRWLSHLFRWSTFLDKKTKKSGILRQYNIGTYQFWILLFSKFRGIKSNGMSICDFG